jgi:hypothetical protein
MPPLLLDQISDTLRWYDSTLNFFSPRKKHFHKNELQKNLSNPNPFGTEEFVQFRQVFD